MVFSTNQENKARVTVYTTPTCPDCRALKSWFDREGIRFEDRDLTDPDIMQRLRTATACALHRSR